MVRADGYRIVWTTRALCEQLLCGRTVEVMCIWISFLKRREEWWSDEMKNDSGHSSLQRAKCTSHSNTAISSFLHFCLPFVFTSLVPLSALHSCVWAALTLAFYSLSCDFIML